MSNFQNPRFDPSKFNLPAPQYRASLIADILCAHFKQILADGPSSTSPFLPRPIPSVVATQVCNHLAMHLGLQVHDERRPTHQRQSAYELRTKAQIERWAVAIQELATLLPWDTDSAKAFAGLARYSTQLALRKNCPEQAIQMANEVMEAAELDDNPKRRLNGCLAAGTTAFRLAKRVYGLDDVKTLRAALALLPFVAERGNREKALQLSSYIESRLHLEVIERRVCRADSTLERIRAWLIEPHAPTPATATLLQRAERLFNLNDDEQKIVSLPLFLKTLHGVRWEERRQHIPKRATDRPFVALVLLRVAQCCDIDPDCAARFIADDTDTISTNATLESMLLPQKAANLLASVGMHDSSVMRMIRDFQNNFFR